MTGMEITEILGNLGDFIGAIAVFGTIVYLAIQVRHSKEATEANTRALTEQHRLATTLSFQTNRRLPSKSRFASSRGLSYSRCLPISSMAKASPQTPANGSASTSFCNHSSIGSTTWTTSTPRGFCRMILSRNCSPICRKEGRNRSYKRFETIRSNPSSSCGRAFVSAWGALSPPETHPRQITGLQNCLDLGGVARMRCADFSQTFFRLTISGCPCGLFVRVRRKRR